MVLVHIHAAKELFSLFSLLVIGIGVYQALFLKKLQCNNSTAYIYIYIYGQCIHLTCNSNINNKKVSLL